LSLELGYKISVLEFENKIFQAELAKIRKSPKSPQQALVTTFFVQEMMLLERRSKNSTFDKPESKIARINSESKESDRIKKSK
jgi:hypothetical protein